MGPFEDVFSIKPGIWQNIPLPCYGALRCFFLGEVYVLTPPGPPKLSNYFDPKNLSPKTYRTSGDFFAWMLTGYNGSNV